ncbi:MAG: 8-amino-7-oxononanoate synthase [Candidatus Omnitrophica bacterium]|nr:8-amino-7-oxononanoate synthase [Candidatus Omnitrophota bacterium]MDD5670314.1 8-amino-7-oxononanoate synthase [Candidatus Omnitrophota bacterium]
MSSAKPSLLEEELTEIREQNLYRRLRVLEPRSSTQAVLNGQEILLFCGNDYLGLTHHPRVVAAAARALERYGVGSGSARLISGTLDIHRQLEEALAQLKRKDKALVFSAGYLANLGVLTALAGEKDIIVMDKLCHASLIDAARLSRATLRVFPHKNYAKCAELLEKTSSYRRKILVSDTVFSMDGDLADLQELVRIKSLYDCLLVVDDAHGTGVLGREGRGAIEDWHLEDRIDVITGTLSKTIGCLGGFAAASEGLIEYLINFSRPFIFATALPPPLCAAALEALKVMREEPELKFRLWQNVQKLHQGILSAGFEMEPVSSPILPIIVGAEKAALTMSEALLRQGILVPAVRYPTVPKGKARLRVTVSAAHRDEDLNHFTQALTRFRESLNHTVSR